MSYKDPYNSTSTYEVDKSKDKVDVVLEATKLLSALEQKAEERITEKVRFLDNIVNVEIHSMLEPISLELKMNAYLKLNGVEHKISHSEQSEWGEDISVLKKRAFTNLATKISNKIANEIVSNAIKKGYVL